MTITPKQLELAKAIKKFRDANGFGPTLQDMADALGVNKVTIHERVHVMLDRGLLIGMSGKSRSLEVASFVDLSDPRERLARAHGFDMLELLKKSLQLRSLEALTLDNSKGLGSRMLIRQQADVIENEIRIMINKIEGER